MDIKRNSQAFIWLCVSLPVSHVMAERTIETTSQSVQKAFPTDSIAFPIKRKISDANFDMTGRKASKNTLIFDIHPDTVALIPCPAFPRRLFTLSSIFDHCHARVRACFAIMPPNLSFRPVRSAFIPVAEEIQAFPISPSCFFVSPSFCSRI